MGEGVLGNNNQIFLPVFSMPISSVSKKKIGASAYPSTPPPVPRIYYPFGG